MGREGIVVTGTPIAEGVVIVTADAKDVPRDVARDVDSGQAALTSTGNRAGSSLFAGFTKFALGAVATVGTIGVAVGGLALKGGFDRALSIQDATKKLEGLGHDTTAVSSIMASALNSVRGTAFGLGAAATTSAGLVAAGVGLGEELERRLKTVADTATIAGRSMEDVGTIFGSVAAKGRLQGDDLLQLMSSGVPVLQFLAQHLGITSEAVSEMVSRGEIDFATFADAMEEGIGGAALRGGETARGSFANVMAALGRFGAGFATPLVAGIPAFFQSVAGAIDEVAGALAPVTTAFSTWLTPALQTASDVIGAIDWGDVANGILAFSPLAYVAQWLGPLVPMFSELGQKIWPVLSDALEDLAVALEPVLPLLGEALADAIIQLAPPLTDLLIALIPLIPSLVILATEALPPLVDILSFLVPILIPVVGSITAFYTVVGDLLGLLSGQTAVGDFGEHLATAQGPIYDITRAIADFIMPALGWLISTLSILLANWQTAWGIIGNFFSNIAANVVGTASWLWATLSGAFQTGVSRVSSIFSALPSHIMNLFAGAGAWLVSSGRSLIQGFINGINSMIGSVGTAVGNLMDWAAGFFPHSPAKRGPFSGDGWTKVFEGGGSLIDQFTAGAEARRPTINIFGGNVEDVVNISRGPQPPFPTSGGGDSGGAPLIGGDLVINEAEDPLGSAGRLETSFRRFAKKG